MSRDTPQDYIVRVFPCKNLKVGNLSEIPPSWFWLSEKYWTVICLPRIFLGCL